MIRAIRVGEVVMDVRKVGVCESGEQPHLAIVGIGGIDDLAWLERAG